MSQSAKEKGYFEEEDLFVTLEAQANWKVLLNGVIDGQLDGAHMLAGQPLAATRWACRIRPRSEERPRPVCGPPRNDRIREK